MLSHIYAAANTWFEIISGKNMNEALANEDQLKVQAETKSIEEMKKTFLDLSERYKALLNSQKDIDKAIVVDNPYAGVLETSISELVLHVVTHGF